MKVPQNKFEFAILQRHCLWFAESERLKANIKREAPNHGFFGPLKWQSLPKCLYSNSVNIKILPLANLDTWKL